MNQLTKKLHEYRAMGTNLGALSLLLHAADNVELCASHKVADNFFAYKRVFNLENFQVTVEEDISIDDPDTLILRDSEKFFAPYFKPTVISAHGKQYPVDPKDADRRFIGMACYPDTKPEHLFNLSTFYGSSPLPFPKNRHYAIEHYGLIFNLILAAGFDVMTFDSHGISLEEKAYLLNTHCQAVIGYEGGLSHMAHILNVPYIMLPWHRFSPYGNTVTPDEINYQNSAQVPFHDARHNFTYAMHLDEKTYFLENINEILTWTPEHLHEILYKLRNNNGNNPFLNKDNTTFMLRRDMSQYILNYRGAPGNIRNISSAVSPTGIDFSMKYYPELKVGGIKEVTWMD